MISFRYNGYLVLLTGVPALADHSSYHWDWCVIGEANEASGFMEFLPTRHALYAVGRIVRMLCTHR